MAGLTGEFHVDLGRGLGECASKTIMTHILAEGFHGQRNMIKVQIQGVAEPAQVSSKEEPYWSRHTGTKSPLVRRLIGKDDRS